MDELYFVAAKDVKCKDEESLERVEHGERVSKDDRPLCYVEETDAPCDAKQED